LSNQTPLSPLPPIKNQNVAWIVFLVLAILYFLSVLCPSLFIGSISLVSGSSKWPSLLSFSPFAILIFLAFFIRARSTRKVHIQLENQKEQREADVQEQKKQYDADYALFVTQSEARVNKWNYDPLLVIDGYIGFDWTPYEEMCDYVQNIEDLVMNGAKTRPTQSELIELFVPETFEPNESFPEPVNNTLKTFTQENDELRNS